VSRDDSIQPQAAVQPMLRIAWSRGPDLPQGLQDGCAGIVKNALITACGFCNGDSSKASPDHKDKYPRGFLQKTWALDLRKPKRGWAALPDFPGAARQGLSSAAVHNAAVRLGRVQLHLAVLLPGWLQAFTRPRRLVVGTAAAPSLGFRRGQRLRLGFESLPFWRR